MNLSWNLMAPARDTLEEFSRNHWNKTWPNHRWQLCCPVLGLVTEHNAATARAEFHWCTQGWTSRKDPSFWNGMSLFPTCHSHKPYKSFMSYKPQKLKHQFAFRKHKKNMVDCTWWISGMLKLESGTGTESLNKTLNSWTCHHTEASSPR